MTTCIKYLECPEFEFNPCSHINYQRKCAKLNEYLIKDTEKKEHIDYSSDMGLIRVLEKMK